MSLVHRSGVRSIRTLLPTVQLLAAGNGSILKQHPCSQCVRPSSSGLATGTVRFDGPSNTDGGDELDSNEQARRANLGSMVEQLRQIVPNLLVKPVPKSLVSSQVILRICPTRLHQVNSYIPTAVKGTVSYYATFKAIQLIMTSVVLSDKVRLHIQSIRVVTEDDAQTVNPSSTKIRVRWITCSPGCYHLSLEPSGGTSSNFHSTSAAKLGSHRLDKIGFLNNPSAKDQTMLSLPSITSAISQLSSALLSKDKEKIERVISGIFIFELNQDNDKITVHTIEDIDLVEKTETESVGGLRVC